MPLNINKMKAPNDIRPTWRGGVLQIHITRSCDLACTACTQGSNLAGKPTIMSLENFELACASLKGYNGVVGIFGGNPTLHPRFPDVLRILSQYISFEQRGLWSNNLRQHGKICRETFNPSISNINVHGNALVYADMIRDWPELANYKGTNLKGLEDSRHSPPYVAMKDMEDLSNDDMYRLIESCDVNQLWSSMICQFRGEVRGFFCELAGAQSMLHEHDKSYPDTGVPCVDGWWRAPMESFAEQVQKHCFECGVPLRGSGDLAIGGKIEYVSKTHEAVYKLKRPGSREIRLVKNTKELNGSVTRATDYIENGVRIMSDAKVMVGIPTVEMARRADFYDYLNTLRIPVGSMRCSPHAQSPARGRNLIIEQALVNDCTHVFFLDDDVLAPNDAVEKLLAHDKDIVSGLYPMRSYPHKPIAFDEFFYDAQHKWVTMSDDVPEGLVPIKNCGLGCVLIKIEVFKKMQPSVTTALGPKWVTMGTLHGDEWDDDIAFFLRCRDLGYEMWLDTSVQAGHVCTVALRIKKHNGKWYTEYDSSGAGHALVPQHIPSDEEKALTDKVVREGYEKIHGKPYDGLRLVPA